jgi:hypothetical protein
MKVLTLSVFLLSGCAEMPDRLDMLADTGREFAIVHPVVTGAALMAARAALHKPQHLLVMCDPRCRVGSNPPPGAAAAGRVGFPARPR